MTYARRLIALVGFAILPANTLAAQTMEIRLRDETTMAPIVGAIVRLQDDRGTVAQGLSNESGWLVLRGTAAGSYRLKVDRIGWAGVVAGPFVLAAGETLRRELHLSSSRLELPALTVEAASRCNRSSQGGSLAVALWEEIRKALTANVISGAGASLPLHVREFNRELDVSARPLREYLVLSRVFRGHTYSALAPGVLAKGGFIFARGDKTMYAAPDAESLLSEEFVANHCFRAVPGTGALVGLAFEPIRDRKVIDVRGTLWVDRRTSELDFLEYRYTGISDQFNRAEVGGRVAFRRLPTGSWIVSSWHIRRPQLLREEIIGGGNTSRFRTRVTGYHDRGAIVEIAADSLGRATRAIVFGEIYDSIAGKGLENAIVYIEGLPDSILTDTAGHYELAVAASGTYVVAVRHRRIGLLGRPGSRTVVLTPGDTAMVDFSVPAPASVAQALCGPGWMVAGLVGILLSADSTPAIGFDIRIPWREPDGARREEIAQTGARGLFAVCGELPPARNLPLRVYAGKQALMEFPLRLTGNSLLWAELAMVEEKRKGR